jgi:hypothetical protein
MIEDNTKKKCSSDEHNEIDAIFYCQECKIYLCNKCDKHHYALFKKHLKYNINEIFTGLCREKNHSNKLEYYCKNHNKLCCVECFKAKGIGNGQHKDCDVCFVTEIKDKKKDELNNNIKYLDNLLKNLPESIDQLKKIFEVNGRYKELLKSEVQKKFTEVRNALNNTLDEREKKLLSEIDQKYEQLFSKEDLIKESEELPYKINALLEKSKIKDIEWNDQTILNSIINNCIYIENNIKNIKLIDNNINKCKSNVKKNIDFKLTDDKYNELLEKIKEIGVIEANDIDYKALSKEKVLALYAELESEFNLSLIIPKDVAIKKIIEFKGDRELFNEWIFELL